VGVDWGPLVRVVRTGERKGLGMSTKAQVALAVELWAMDVKHSQVRRQMGAKAAMRHGKAVDFAAMVGMPDTDIAAVVRRAVEVASVAGFTRETVVAEAAKIIAARNAGRVRALSPQFIGALSVSGFTVR
jgi:hypothetical protein